MGEDSVSSDEPDMLAMLSRGSAPSAPSGVPPEAQLQIVPCEPATEPTEAAPAVAKAKAPGGKKRKLRFAMPGPKRRTAEQNQMMIRIMNDARIAK